MHLQQTAENAAKQTPMQRTATYCCRLAVPDAASAQLCARDRKKRLATHTVPDGWLIKATWLHINIVTMPQSKFIPTY
jgi:hypothetical protein